MLKRRQKIRSLLVDGALTQHIIKERPYRYFLRISVALLCVGALLLLYPSIQYANTRTFYPTLCLGDWEHPDRAEGKPKGVNWNGSGAALRGTDAADIFCSQFAGEQPADTQISKVILHLSLYAGSLKNLETEDAQEGVEITETVSKPVVENETQEEVAPDTTDVEGVAGDTPNEETQPDGEEQVLPETVEPETAEEPVAWRFIRIAHAEEMGTTTSDDSETLVVTDDTEETQEESSDTADETEDVGTTTVVVEEQVATTNTSTILEEKEEVFESPETSDEDTEEPDEHIYEWLPDDVPLVSVRYTTDGSEWFDLGVITTDTWEDYEIELPLTHWSEIENLQILLQGSEGVEYVPVYLDGMSLAVSFEHVQEVEPEIFPEDIPLEEVNNEPITDPRSKHTCVVEPFSRTVSRGEKTEFGIVTQPSLGGTAWNLRVGNLPVGIEAVLNPGIPGKERPLAVAISREAAVGSYSAVVVYFETQEDGEVLPNFCQFNIVVEE